MACNNLMRAMNSSDCDLGLWSDCLFWLLYEMKLQLQCLNSEGKRAIQTFCFKGWHPVLSMEALFRPPERAAEINHCHIPTGN